MLAGAGVMQLAMAAPDGMGVAPAWSPLHIRLDLARKVFIQPKEGRMVDKLPVWPGLRHQRAAPTGARGMGRQLARRV